MEEEYGEFINLRGLRALINAALGDWLQLKAFCLDNNFEAVYQEFTDNQTQSFRIQILIEWCWHNNRLDYLRQLLKVNYNGQYKSYEAQLQINKEQTREAQLSLVNVADMVRSLKTELKETLRQKGVGTHLQLAYSRIQMLADAKFVHDFLHNLQNDVYNLLVRDAQRFSENADDVLLSVNSCEVRFTEWYAEFDALRQHSNERDIKGQEEALGGKAGAPPQQRGIGSDASGQEEQEEQRRRLNQMLVQVNAALVATLANLRAVSNAPSDEPVAALRPKLTQTVERLRNIVENQPTRFNAFLNKAARSLPLTTIIEALLTMQRLLANRTGEAAMEAPELAASDNAVQAVEDAIDSIMAVLLRLYALVAEHDHFQQFVDDLRSIYWEDADLALTLQGQWPALREGLDWLCEQAPASWRQNMLMDMAQLEAALLAGDSRGARMRLSRIQYRAEDRFYAVDTTLKELCKDLRKVGDALRNIVEAL